MRPHRLAWFRTPPFQGGDTGSNPVTNAKRATLAADRIRGRANGAGAGDTQDLTPTQVRTIINVESDADVTDESNVTAALNGATPGSITVASGDKVFVQDITDSDNLKTVTAQSIADLGGGGGGGDAWSDPVDAVITPDADGTRDLATTGARFATGFLDALDITNNIVVGGTVDGRDVAADGSKIDGIEAGATADQTGAEIKAAYEGEANAYTDAKDTKLSGIETGADVTDAANVVAALSGASLTGALDAADQIVGKQNIKDYAIESTTPAISSGTLTLDMVNGNDFDVSWSSNITTLTVSNWAPSGTLGKLTLRLAMDGTVRTVAWPSGWKWPGGTEPTDPSINQDIFVTVWSRDGGTTIYAAEIGQAFA